MIKLIILGGKKINIPQTYEGLIEIQQISLPASSMEEVERKYEPQLDQNFVGETNNIVVFGGTNSSGIILKICEQLKNTKINVFYVVPRSRMPSCTSIQVAPRQNCVQCLARVCKIR
jgi:hypothetical protein